MLLSMMLPTRLRPMREEITAGRKCGFRRLMHITMHGRLMQISMHGKLIYEKTITNERQALAALEKRLITKTSGITQHGQVIHGKHGNEIYNFRRKKDGKSEEV